MSTVIETRTRVRHGRAAAVWVLQGLTALGFLASASGKFTGQDRMTAVFEAMGADGGLMYAIGTVEVLGAVGLLVPRLSGLAATGFVALMAGALGTHAVVGGSAVPAVAMLVLSAVIAWARWPEPVTVVRSVLGRAGRT